MVAYSSKSKNYWQAVMDQLDPKYNRRWIGNQNGKFATELVRFLEIIYFLYAISMSVKHIDMMQPDLSPFMYGQKHAPTSLLSFSC